MSSFQQNHFEKLCANFAAEKLQQFYQTHIFKRISELANAEGVHSDFDWQLFTGATGPYQPLSLTGFLRKLGDGENGDEERYADSAVSA